MTDKELYNFGRKKLDTYIKEGRQKLDIIIFEIISLETCYNVDYKIEFGERDPLEVIKYIKKQHLKNKI